MRTIHFTDNEEKALAIKKTLQKDELVIIVDNVVTSKYRKARKIRHCSDFRKKYRYVTCFDTLQWFQKWCNKKSISGKSIKEFFLYNKDLSLWYFLEYMIYYEPYPLVPSVATITYYIDVYEKVWEKHHPEQVIIHGSSTQLRLAKAFFEKKASVTRKKSLPSIKHMAKTSPTLVRLFLQHQINRRRRTTSSADATGKDLLLVSSERLCKDKIEKHPFFGKIYEDLGEKRAEVLLYDLLYKRDSLGSAKKKLAADERYLFIGNYYNEAYQERVKDVFRFIQKKYADLLKNGSLKRKLVYKGIALFPFVKQRFDFICKGMALFVADAIAIGEQIVNIKQPKNILTEHDENYLAKSLNYWAKKNDINTLSLQTELIYKDGCVSRHIPDKEAQDKQSKLWRPLANVKFVDGKDAKKGLLSYCNYSKDQDIIITGKPSLDNMHSFHADKKKLIKQHRIPTDKKILVFGSGNIDHDKDVIDKLLTAMKDVTYAHLVIKPHPNTDMRRLKSVIDSYQLKNVTLLPGKMDINDAIAMSDAFISVTSTVIQNAIMSGKDVLLLSPTIGYFPYGKFGAALEVSDLDKIEQGIKTILYDKEVKTRLATGRERFIEEYLYRNDGKAGQRLVESLKEHLKT